MQVTILKARCGMGEGWAISTLRIRLVASLADRTRCFSKHRNLSLADAEHFVKEKDQDTIEFVESHFFKAPSDPAHCDLLLNRSRWSVAECAALAIQALHGREHRMAEA